MNYCMGCHSLKYARYNRVADDLGIPEDLFQANLMFDPNTKIGSLMDNAMDDRTAKAWFGATPPDLTLVSRARQPEWLYTYLRTFYQDRQPTLRRQQQGVQGCGYAPCVVGIAGHAGVRDGPGCRHNGGVKRDPLTGEDILEDPCGQFTITEAGQMTPEEYDAAMYDLVNFLAYTAEPMAADRQRIGTFALLFIVLFFVFAWLLNREYWKDVH